MQSVDPSKVTLTQLFRMHSTGELSRNELELAILSLRSSADWLQWISRQLMFCGVVLILSGILYVLAFNWEVLGRFTKHGLMFCLFIGFGGYAAYAGSHTIKGKLGSLSAGVCAGAWLAVIGQVYQTGADAWQLFAGCIFLVGVWIPLFRFAPSLMLCWTLTNLTLVLYWWQVAVPGDIATVNVLYLLLGGINSLFLLFTERCLPGTPSWLEGAWLRLVLLLYSTIAFTVPTCRIFLEPALAEWDEWFLVVCWLSLLVIGYRYYAFRSLVMVTLLVTSLLVVLLPSVGRLLIINDSPLGYWAFAIVLLFSFGGSAYWLNWLHHTKLVRESAHV